MYLPPVSTKLLSSRTCSTSCAAWLLVAGALLFLHICTPPVWDDWSYLERSWADVLPSAYLEYFTWNGRVIGTTLTRVFALMPTWTVDAVNTAGFLLYACLLLYLAFGNQWRKAASHWAAPVMIWALSVAIVPIFGEVFLWHCGCACYLWPHLACLGLLAFFRRPFDKKGAENDKGRLRTSLLGIPNLVLLAVAAGWSLYHSGPAVWGLACLMVWFGRSHYSPRWLPWLLLLACLAGCILMLVAPGNGVRLDLIRQSSDYRPVSLFSMIGRLLEPHARAIPLYLAFVFAIRWRVKRGFWEKEDRIVFWGALGAATATQVVFLACPTTPPMRSWQITFAFVTVAALRVFLPMFHLCVRRKLWAAVLGILALLPLLAFPKAWRQYEWLNRAFAQLEASRNSNADVVLPYWPFAKDKLFGFMRCFVASEDTRSFENEGIAHAFGLRTVRQSALRCTYSGQYGSWRLSGSSYDAPQYTTQTEWRIQQAELNRPQPFFSCYNLLIAHPGKRSRWYAASALINRWRGGGLPTKNKDELLLQGYVVDTVSYFTLWGRVPKTIVWIRGKQYSKKPETPLLWVAVASLKPLSPPVFTPFQAYPCSKSAGRKAQYTLQNP